MNTMNTDQYDLDTNKLKHSINTTIDAFEKISMPWSIPYTYLTPVVPSPMTRDEAFKNVVKKKK